MSRIILAYFILVGLTVPAVATDAPTTQPATRPAYSPDKLQELQAKALAADVAIQTAENESLTRLAQSPPYKAATADAAAKEQALEKARASGTPYERLDASAAFNMARAEVERL